MATNNPMAEYNKNNPFVIQVRRNYDLLMDLYVKTMNSIIVYAATVIVCIGVACIPYIFIPKNIVWYAVSSISHAVFAWVMIRYTIKNTMKNPINAKIDNIVSLQMQDIVKINLEDVYNTNGDIREHIGFTTGIRSGIENLIILSITYTIAIMFVALL